MTHQARLYAATGRQPEAQAKFEQAIQLYGVFVKPDHPAMLSTLRSYAKFLRHTRQKKQAKKIETLIARSSEQSERQSASAQLVDVQTLLRENGR